MGQIKTMTLEEVKALPKLSKDELSAIEAIKDSEIDLSDIPEITAEQFKNAKRLNTLHKQETVSIKLDTDLLDILKKTGLNYQTQINTILREALLHQ